MNLQANDENLNKNYSVVNSPAACNPPSVSTCMSPFLLGAPRKYRRHNLLVSQLALYALMRRTRFALEQPTVV